MRGSQVASRLTCPVAERIDETPQAPVEAPRAEVVRDKALGGSVDVDGEGGIGRRAVGAGRSYGDVVACGGFSIQQRPVGHGDDTCVGIDRESSSRVVGQRVSYAVGCRIGIGGRGGNSHRRSIGRVLVHRVGRCVGIGWRRDVEFVDIVDFDGEGGNGRRAVGADHLEPGPAQPHRVEPGAGRDVALEMLTIQPSPRSG